MRKGTLISWWLSALVGHLWSWPSVVRADDDLPLPPVLRSAHSPEKLKYLQEVMKNGKLDSLELMTSVARSSAFQKIYDNVEIQHRLLEASPFLQALPGFKEARGRRLSDQETTISFKKGVESLLELTQSLDGTVKDPGAAMKVLNKRMALGDSYVKDLLVAAKAGQEDAKVQLSKVVAQELFPGVDMDVLDEVHKSITFDRILDEPQLMHFIDQDEHLSGLFRTGVMLPSTQERRQAEREKQDP